MINITWIEKGYSSITDDSGKQVGAISRVSNRYWAVINMNGKILTQQKALSTCEQWCVQRSQKLTGIKGDTVSPSGRGQWAANGVETKTDVAFGLFLYLVAFPVVAMSALFVVLAI